MKRKLLFIGLLGSFLVSNAQIFNSGFENNNGTPLSAYKKINADGLMVAPWAPIQDFNNEAWIQFYDGFDNKIAMSTSNYGNGGASNDWLITPAITLPAQGNPTLYWKAKSYDDTAPDNYDILISTTDDQQASFTKLITVTAEQAYFFNSRTLDLSAYKGKTIYIAFLNNTDNGYYLALDDLYISNSNNCEMPDMTGMNVSGLTQKSFSVNWQPTSGINSYDVGLTDFNTPVASLGIQNATQKSFDNLTPGKRYQLFLKNADCGSGWAGPKSIFTAVLPPYSYGFETTVENYGEYDSDGWTSDTWINGSNSAAANSGEGYVFNNTSKTYAKNDWIYSYPIWLESGETATINYSAAMGSDAATPATLKLSVANSPNKTANFQDLSTQSISGKTYKNFSGTFTASSSGVYYFGFGNVTGPVANNSSLRLDDVNITKSGGLSTQEQNSVNLQVYPNPVSDKLYIRTTGKIIKTDIYSVDGKLLKSVSGASEIDFSNLAKGLYLLKIQTEKGVTVKKIVK